MRRMTMALGVGVLGVLAAAACSEPGPEPEPMPAELYGTCGASTLYRVTQVEVPSTSAEAEASGLDLDGDGAPDNVLGQINALVVGAVSGRESDWAQRAIDDGRLDWLLEVEHCQASGGTYTRVSSHRGLASGGFDRGGLPAIGVNGADPGDGEGLWPLSAFAELPGNADNDVRWARGIGLAASVTESETGLSGVLAIGITPPDVRGITLPTFAMGMNRVVSDTEGCPFACTDGSDAAILIELFDDDGDGLITADELAADSLISALSQPDVDLVAGYDGEPVYWPGHDGRSDHMSAGIRIEAEEISP